MFTLNPIFRLTKQILQEKTLGWKNDITSSICWKYLSNLIQKHIMYVLFYNKSILWLFADFLLITYILKMLVQLVCSFNY